MPILRGMRSASKYIWIVVFITFVGGFLFLDMSGLLGDGSVAPSSTVASVNGTKISYMSWMQRVEFATQQQTDQAGRSLTLDETKLIQTRVLDEMVLEILLDAEYKRRGITVSNDEIQRAARLMPHPSLMQSPDLQTDGRFDPAKYERFLGSPSTRSSGQLASLEAYYRSEIPRLKLFEQVVADIHITDAEMWAKWRDVNDSVEVSFVALTADAQGDSIAVEVSESEIRRHYDANRDLYKQDGRGLLSLVHIPKIITSADSAATLAKAKALRAEVLAGSDSAFQEVARRESDDQRSAPLGGDLPRGVKGEFLPGTFETTAYALKAGEISQPVLTPYGYYLIQLVDRKQDTLTLRQIALKIKQNDSAAIVLDKKADALTTAAGATTELQKLEEAAVGQGLRVEKSLVFEGQPLMLGGKYVPSVSAWAFSGAFAGEVSDLYENDDGYYLARLDSLVDEGLQPFGEVHDVIKLQLTRKKKLQKLVPLASQIATQAASSTLEAAAKAHGASVQHAPIFNRIAFVPGIGRDNEAIGAAFALPSGSISTPVVTEDAVFVLRVDKRVSASREAWQTQRAVQRMIQMQSMQQDRIQAYLRGLRESAKIVDKRKELARQGRVAA